MGDALELSYAEIKCSGVSPGHIIEKTLMRSLKSAGSLTRGTGFEEVQRNIYILSRPACAEVSTSIKELTGTKYFNDQRKSSSNSRVERADTDIDKCIIFFK